MSLFTLYLLFILIPNLSGLMGLTLLLFLLITLCTVPILLLNEDDDIKQETKDVAVRGYKLIFKTALTLFILSFLAPNQKEMFLLTGGWVAINNEEVQKLPENVLGAMNSYLEAIQKELDNVETKTDVKDTKEVVK